MATQRRKFSTDEKIGIVQKAGQLGVTAVLHEHHLSYSVFARWRKQYQQANASAAEHAAANKVRSELKQLLEENARLKKIIADQALELERREEDLRKYKK
ncbi:transposase [Paraflavitalea pollutisoli]|uniref:transposase n=1 Tax=Paraflavitalea pollutisoli TaxID=3034143 RepID=UPI0023ED9423|nr:transposase [Paraflavitalea sp. H1-2-19X]